MGLLKNCFCLVLLVCLNDVHARSAESSLEENIDSVPIVQRLGRHFLIGVTTTAESAKSLCKRKDAKLVSIEDVEEDADLGTLLSKIDSEGGWTSGRAVIAGKFEWTSTNKPLLLNAYNNFADEDYKTKVGCVFLGKDELTGGYKWRIDETCTTNHHVVCERAA